MDAQLDALFIEFQADAAHFPFVCCAYWWHGGVIVKRFGFIVGLGAALAVLAGHAAIALEEQKVQSAPAAAQTDAPKAEVQDASAPKSKGGTEVRIPGLGKLGTLPKMDFGLELLYGASEGPKATPDPVPENIDPQHDLTIRGSVKHSF